MNIIKAQKTIFNALLSGKQVRRCEHDKDNVFITVDGIIAYVLPYSVLQVNLDRIKEMRNQIDTLSIVKEENIFRLTREMLIKEHPKELYRKLTNGDRNVFINQKYLEYFQNPKFYQKEKNQMVVVTEDISVTRKNVIVGIIMPVRVEEDLFK